MEMLEEKNVLETLEAMKKINDRAQQVFDLCDPRIASPHFTFPLEEGDDPTEFRAEWEETWNYGGHEFCRRYIPLRYLWMPDDEVLAEVEAERKREEEEKARKKAVAEATALLREAGKVEEFLTQNWDRIPDSLKALLRRAGGA
jgi:hypothetical protein